MTTTSSNFDVAIIGAGPAGSVAAALLHGYGYNVVVVERQHFPRFSIGESLLPQCMEFLERAKLRETVEEAADALHFQYKKGATFLRGDEQTTFDFHNKLTSGPATTFQVLRSSFDDLLIREVARRGVEVRWGETITGIDFDNSSARLQVTDEAGKEYFVNARFVLDASGFGRVLPRLLNLDSPSEMLQRTSIFTHIEGRVDESEFDHSTILISVHPENPVMWFWLIPFANNRYSLGVVVESQFLDRYGDASARHMLQDIVDSYPQLQRLLRNTHYLDPIRTLSGYSSNVTSLWGENFALLGNAGEFLDPIFSSGVTIAMKSSCLAASALHRQFQGESVDWNKEYSEPLMVGVNTFREFVNSWYDQRLQTIIFSRTKRKRFTKEKIEDMLCSILAGYAWDVSNPYVSQTARRLDILAKVCQS